MNPKKMFENRAAETAPGKAGHVACLNCDEDIVFAMSDKYHEFSIGLRTILRCLKIAENEGSVPPLPTEWWISIAHRHGLQFPRME